jgi:hypothetical protein
MHIPFVWNFLHYNGNGGLVQGKTKCVQQNVRQRKNKTAVLAAQGGTKTAAVYHFPVAP